MVVCDEDVVWEEFVTFFDEFTIFSVFLIVGLVGLSALLGFPLKRKSVWSHWRTTFEQTNHSC